jgi:hypothetical protein
MESRENLEKQFPASPLLEMNESAATNASPERQRMSSFRNNVSSAAAALRAWCGLPNSRKIDGSTSRIRHEYVILFIFGKVVDFGEWGCDSPKVPGGTSIFHLQIF